MIGSRSCSPTERKKQNKTKHQKHKSNHTQSKPNKNKKPLPKNKGLRLRRAQGERPLALQPHLPRAPRALARRRQRPRRRPQHADGADGGGCGRRQAADGGVGCARCVLDFFGGRWVGEAAVVFLCCFAGGLGWGGVVVAEGASIWRLWKKIRRRKLPPSNYNKSPNQTTSIKTTNQNNHPPSTRAQPPSKQPTNPIFQKKTKKTLSACRATRR